MYVIHNCTYTYLKLINTLVTDNIALVLQNLVLPLPPLEITNLFQMSRYSTVRKKPINKKL